MAQRKQPQNSFQLRQNIAFYFCNVDLIQACLLMDFTKQFVPLTSAFLTNHLFPKSLFQTSIITAQPIVVIATRYCNISERTNFLLLFSSAFEQNNINRALHSLETLC